jgi:hypothetical protein
MIETFPAFSEITLESRPVLHERFRSLGDGVSEFTFANIYLFRKAHNYRISRLDDERYVIAGSDGGRNFFMLPFGLPAPDLLERLFSLFSSVKAVSEAQSESFRALGYEVVEDRDNHDYLYRTGELAALQGRAFHKKKNLVNAFINNFTYEGKPLLEEYIPHALEVLGSWREQRGAEGDYEAAREALEKTETLSLCGGIYYVDGRPAGYTLGEEIAGGTTYLIHFEKAVPGYKGIYQFINMSFAGILPDKYIYINREQDLGDEGLRQAKLSYRPCGFIKKFRVHRRGTDSGDHSPAA